jgi:uncharacterized damage-inducible protein DinB
MKWFERKFEFNFPVELYPSLCIRLRGTPARLEELVRNTPPGRLIAKVGDKWSAQEHAGHLLDLEPLWLARLKDFLSGGESLTAADLSNRKTHEARHNEQDLQEILAGFRAARGILLENVQNLDVAGFSRTRLHPRLKQPMRLIDHLYFAAEHDDHHLAAIGELTHPVVV